MFNNEIKYKITRPHASIADFVDSFWMVANPSDNEKEIIVLPDGRIDISFTYFGTEQLHTRLSGLSTEPIKALFPPKTVIFAMSLNLLAVEYLLNTSVSNLVNDATQFPENFFCVLPEDLNDFEIFCNKITVKIKEHLKDKVDHRKQKLFELLYSSNGSLTVKELSAKVFWTSRQINRYFNHSFGIPLKTYCRVLRFRASFVHIKEGKLFPEQNFSDQPHFIREVKKISGVIPKELFKNQNDRFIQFTSLPNY
ncbi:MAG: AraC family transcriptional regulator [Bacteroidota bacterium]|nr:AraC family transcriptional regulator [Bacteroidota bacterium]